MKKTVENRAARLITDKTTEDYLDSLCPGNCAILEKIRDQAESDDIPIIRRQSEELLKTVLTLQQPSSILEIGTAVGYSALVMAHTLPKAGIVTLEIGDKDYAMALDNFALYADAMGVNLNIDALLRDADDYLPRAISEGKKFDFIFLDAAKAQYIVWLPYILQILSEGGVLFADNVLLDGTAALSRYVLDRRERTTHRRMREFLYALTHEPRLTSTVLPSGDGVSISVYRS